MYGQAYPCLVYGFNLNDRSIKFDEHWLASKYPLIQCYAIDIVRNYLGEPVYGVQCDIDTDTGVVTNPNEEELHMIKELYDKYLEFYKTYTKNSSNDSIQNVKLGYHLALLGWDDENHEDIVLDDDDENEDPDE